MSNKLNGSLDSNKKFVGRSVVIFGSIPKSKATEVGRFLGITVTRGPRGYLIY